MIWKLQHILLRYECRVFIGSDPMSHRILSMLLIGTTLLGSSFCCCSVRAEGAEPARASCCGHRDDSSTDCPNRSDDGDRHQCPCRGKRSIAANLYSSQVLPTAPLTKWIADRVLFPAGGDLLQGCELHPQSMQLREGRSELYEGGTAILIANCVSRC